MKTGSLESLNVFATQHLIPKSANQRCTVFFDTRSAAAICRTPQGLESASPDRMSSTSVAGCVETFELEVAYLIHYDLHLSPVR